MAMHGGFQFLLILDLWGITFHAVVVFGLGKDLLIEYVLGHCVKLHVHKKGFFETPNFLNRPL